MKVVVISDVPDNVELVDGARGTLEFLANTPEGSELTMSQAVTIHNVDELLERVEVDRSVVKDNSVIIFKFPSDFSYEEMEQVKTYLQAQFSTCTVIGIVNDMEVLVESPEDAIKLLERMIAHIKVSTGTSSKIILT